MLPTIYTNSEANSNHDFENMLEIEHAKIKAVAYTNGKMDGMKDPAQPYTKGDKLIHYIGFKSSYENLALKVLQRYQPALQLVSGRMDKDMAEMHSKRLAGEIEKLQKQISILTRELGHYDPSNLDSRIKRTLISGIALFIGEVVLNAQAFQVTGENLLSSLILSASVSLAVCLGAHFTGRKYKDAKTIMEKRIIIVISAIGILSVSAVIASLRTIFLKRIGVDVNPIYFTVFNIVFFLITAFATWYMYPTHEELEQNRVHLQKHKLILKLEKEKKLKENELQEHENMAKENLKVYLSTMMYVEIAIERIKKMYRESIDTYIGANRLGRKDIPDYLNDEVPPLDIPIINFNSITNKYKDNENNNNNTVD